MTHSSTQRTRKSSGGKTPIRPCSDLLITSRICLPLSTESPTVSPVLTVALDPLFLELLFSSFLLPSVAEFNFGLLPFLSPTSTSVAPHLLKYGRRSSTIKASFGHNAHWYVGAVPRAPGGAWHVLTLLVGKTQRTKRRGAGVNVHAGLQNRHAQHRFARPLESGLLIFFAVGLKCLLNIERGCAALP